MGALDAHSGRTALRRVLDRLDAIRSPADPPLRLLVVGGTAGLLGGLLRPSRTTADCDVVWLGSDAVWDEIAGIASEVAHELALPESWLNRAAGNYAWMFPLGWMHRCEMIERKGSVEILILSRIDLIAAKVISAPKRPQDLEDLHDLQPTDEELGFALANLDRVEHESGSDVEMDDARTVIDSLRGGKT